MSTRYMEIRRPIQRIAFQDANGRYVHQDYPAARYHEDGRVELVQDEHEDVEKCPESEGWRKEPFPPKPAEPKKPEPTAAELKAALAAAEAERDKSSEALKALEAKYASLKDAHQALSDAHAEKATEAIELRAQLAKAAEAAKPAEAPAAAEAEAPASKKKTSTKAE